MRNVKSSIFFIGVCVCLTAAYILWREYSGVQSTDLAYITIGKQELLVEVAKTPEQIEEGLSDRTRTSEVGAEGMLFVLPRRYIPTFWMKDMLFPLDFIWIDGDKVVDVTKNVSAPARKDIPDQDLLLHKPVQEVTYVLEVEVGTIEELGLKVGDRATIKSK